MILSRTCLSTASKIENAILNSYGEISTWEVAKDLNYVQDSLIERGKIFSRNI